jgi:cytoskeletal protein CcmA (bactofilin family)
MTTTLIAKRTRVGGRIETHGDVMVEGRVEGSIVADGCVTVGVSGVAVSDIHAGRAVVLGIVIGNIEASERIDVASSARIVGDVRAPAISVASPASVEGRIDETPAAAHAPARETTSSGRLSTVPPAGGVQATRPTLRIRGAGLVRPARPDGQSGSSPAVEPRQNRITADLGQRAARTRDPSQVPAPPRPPRRTRMLPHVGPPRREDED